MAPYPTPADRLSNPPDTLVLRRTLFLLSALTVLSTCSQPDRVMVNEVLNHHQCAKVKAGVAQVDKAQIAGIRGATQVMVADVAQTPTRNKTLMATDPTGEGVPAEAPSELFVAVSRGRQPTTGYALKLLRAGAKGRTVTLDYEWQQPGPDSMQAQVITSPCSVVQLSFDTGVEAVAATMNGEAFATLELAQSAE